MKVILTKQLEALGDAGEIVSVSGGYARNYLLPNKFAVLADEKSVRVIGHQRKVIEDRRKRELASMQDRVLRIESKSITITKKTGEQDKKSEMNHFLE